MFRIGYHRAVINTLIVFLNDQLKSRIHFCGDDCSFFVNIICIYSEAIVSSGQALRGGYMLWKKPGLYTSQNQRGK